MTPPEEWNRTVRKKAIRIMRTWWRLGVIDGITYYRLTRRVDESHDHFYEAAADLQWRADYFNKLANSANPLIWFNWRPLWYRRRKEQCTWEAV